MKKRLKKIKTIQEFIQSFNFSILNNFEKDFLFISKSKQIPWEKQLKK